MPITFASHDSNGGGSSTQKKTLIYEKFERKRGREKTGNHIVYPFPRTLKGFSCYSFSQSYFIISILGFASKQLK